MESHGCASAGRPEPDAHRTRRVCAHCRDIIGAYEPIWIALADGSLRQSSLLNLDKDTPQGSSITQVWHAGCLAADTIARSHET